MKTILALDGCGLTERTGEDVTVVAVGAAASDVQADWWVLTAPADVKPKGKPKTWAPLGSGIETKHGFVANADCKADANLAAIVLLSVLGVKSAEAFGLNQLDDASRIALERAARQHDIVLVARKAPPAIPKKPKRKKG